MLCDGTERIVRRLSLTARVLGLILALVLLRWVHATDLTGILANEVQDRHTVMAADTSELNTAYLPLIIRSVDPPDPYTILSFDSSDCGQVVTIPDGEYAQLFINARCSDSAPLTIHARTDGHVRFDARYANCEGNLCPACYVYESSYVNISGVVCHHAQDATVQVSGSDHIRLHRVSAYEAGPDYDDHIFDIYRSQDMTLEDCAAVGRGRNPYLVFESSRIHLRRTFAQYATHGTQQAASYFQIYGSSDCLIENFVGVRARSDIYVDAGQYWYASWNRDEDRVDRNRTVGSVFIGHDYHGLNVLSANQQLHGNSVEDSVFIGNDTEQGYGVPYTAIFQRCDDDFKMDQLTLVHHKIAVGLSHDANNPWFDIIGTLTNSSITHCESGIDVAQYPNIRTELDHRYNNFYDVTATHVGVSQGPGETFINPGYDVEQYGNGAYLFVPPMLQGQGSNGADVGASVLYQSLDGVLTDERLWPWPMEARICAETTQLLGDGISVTYESRQVQYDYDNDSQPETYVCTGGIWRTLEGVY